MKHKITFLPLLLSRGLLYVLILNGLLWSESVKADLPTAQQLASKMKVGWNLGNTLEATGGETSWGNPKATQRLIDSVKAVGYNAVRLPVSWDTHANPTTHVIDPTWLARVKEVVDYCIKDSMYVFFNVHWDNGWLENHVTVADSAIVNAKQKTYWTQIATYFRKYDEHLLFASANEPNADNATAVSVLMSYHRTFIRAVRATGGNNKFRTLIIQGPNTNIELTSSLMKMPVDSIENRLMVEVHFYAPYNFVMMGKDETWGKMAYYWGKGYHSIVDPAHNATWGEEDYVTQCFDLMKTNFVDKGFPVIIGEFGTMKRTGIPDLNLHNASREYWYKTVVQTAVNHGCVPFLWATGGDINRNTGVVTERDVVDAIMEGAGLYTPAYFKLDTTINGNGKLFRSPDLSTYKDGSIVTLTAKPGTGLQFDNWSGGLNDTINPTTIVMKANQSIAANFSAKLLSANTMNLIDNVQVYPNPSDGNFKIAGAKNAQLNIYNVSGELVYSRIFTDETTEISSKLESGVYIVKLEENGKVSSSKLLIK
ncbi:MAG: cellulase family glycosylhydrolase [Bacteroidota bacterium]|nr:cellulase family glycosylhydrolase [Bacteroidota bacterium]